LITLQFCLATVVSTSSMLVELIQFPEHMRKVLLKVTPYNFLKKAL
jgi:hypothetical protein